MRRRSPRSASPRGASGPRKPPGSRPLSSRRRHLVAARCAPAPRRKGNSPVPSIERRQAAASVRDCERDRGRAQRDFRRSRMPQAHRHSANQCRFTITMRSPFDSQVGRRGQRRGGGAGGSLRPAGGPEESTVRRLGAGVVKEITRVVIETAQRETRFRGRAARIDSTVVEADVRYPSDAMLTLQGSRTLAREGRKLSRVIGARRGFATARARSARRCGRSPRRWRGAPAKPRRR